MKNFLNKLPKSEKVHTALVVCLTITAIVTPFKENIGQIFLLFGTILCLFSSKRLAKGNNGFWMIITSLGLIGTGTLSTLAGSGRFNPGPSIRLWKYTLASALIVRFLSLSKEQRKQIVSSALISATATAIAIFTLAPTFWDNRYTFFLDRTFNGGSANAFPTIWAIVAILSLAYLALFDSSKENDSEKNWYKRTRLMAAIIFIFALFTVGTGQSRAALGIVITGFIIISIMKASWKAILGSILTIILVLALVPRFRVVPEGENNSYYYRYETCRVALKIAAQHPVLGSGPKTYRENFMKIYGKPLMGFNPRCANNFYASVLAEQGISGLLLLISFIWFAGKELWQRGQNDLWSKIVFIAFMAYLAGGIVLDNRFLALQSGMIVTILIATTKATNEEIETNTVKGL